jgi:hypothetical protein
VRIGSVYAAHEDSLKCTLRNRCHHLLKTFCGWLDRQSPDGMVIWTAPSRRTYTTHPGSRLLFPTLCKPIAPVSGPAVVTVEPNRGLMVPHRNNTRARSRAKRINVERKLNDAYVAERNKPPPF